MAKFFWPFRPFKHHSLLEQARVPGTGVEQQHVLPRWLRAHQCIWGPEAILQGLPAAAPSPQLPTTRGPYDTHTC